MDITTESFEYFNSLYLRKDFESAGILLSLEIFSNFSKIEQPKHNVRDELKKLVREFYLKEYHFSPNSFSKVVSLLGTELQKGAVLSVTAFLN